MTTKGTATQKSLENIEKITGTKLTIGKLIWAIRKADDETQVTFAAKLKISRQHLCDLEHGRKSISPRLASKYALILGYSKELFIQLALQDIVDRDGLNVIVEISRKERKSKNKAAA